VALRILRRRDLAEEAVHDAFVEIWQKAAVFDPARGAALAWITGIVRYRALSILRKRSRETPVEPGDLDDLPDLAADPAEALARLSAADAAAAVPGGARRRQAAVHPAGLRRRLLAQPDRRPALNGRSAP
jgi:DNA-directed RNA polymerase specialized sigma24 family protein